MTLKLTFHLGRLLLLIGVVCRISFPGHAWPIIIIATGGVLKLLYVILSIKNESYKPGIEFSLLIGGLAVFFTGMFLKHHAVPYSRVIMFFGIGMKIVFLILFSKKKRVLAANK